MNVKKRHICSEITNLTLNLSKWGSRKIKKRENKKERLKKPLNLSSKSKFNETSLLYCSYHP